MAKKYPKTAVAAVVEGEATVEVDENGYEKPFYQFIESKRPPKPAPPPYKPSSGATAFNLEWNEWNRRNNLIITLAKECPYTVGDTVIPADEKLYEKEGAYKVTGICKTWNDYRGSETNEHKVPWPQSDNPMIVNAIALSTNKPVIATIQYFKKK